VGSCRFDITIDGGATVSFISTTLAELLKLSIMPNGELARLADKRYRIQSKGEVDFCITEVSTGVSLRMRALVMDNLAVDCYGGTTFQFDNYIVPNIVTSTIHMHGFKYAVCQPPRRPYIAYPPPSMSPHTSQPDPANAHQGRPLQKAPLPSSTPDLKALSPNPLS